MARTEITPTALGRADGSAITWTDIGADGVKFRNTGKEFILLRRDQAAASAVTVSTNFSQDALDLPDLSIALAAGDATEQFEAYGPFPTSYYNQTGGYVHVDSDDSDDMIAVFQLTPVD